ESLESTVFSEGFRGIDDSEVRLNIGRAEIIDKLIEGLKFNQQNASSYPSPIIAAYCTQSSAYLRLDIARKCYFKGAITEVRLWKKARSLPEIQETMFQRLNIENGLTDENLVAYWKLEESIGNRVFNIVCKELLNCKKSLAGKTLEEYQNLGLNNSENLFNTLFNPTASFGQTNNSPNFGIRLNGISDYVDCGQLNILQEDCQGFNAITVEAWVKNLGKMSDGMIVYQGGGWNEDGFSIWKRNQKLRVELQASDEDKKKKLIFDTEDDVFSGNNPKKDDPGEDDSDANENELDSERWYHVSFTWSVGQEIKIYVNGNFKHSNPVNQYEKTCVKSKEEFSKTIIPKVKLNIGRSENYGRYFYGSIAEVRIWDLIRDKNEINKNMNNRLSENTSGLVGYWRLDESDGDRAANSSQPGGNTKPSYDDYGLVHGGVWEKLYSALDLEISQGAYGVISSQARIVRASQYPALDLPCGLRFKEEGSSVEVKDLSIGQDGTQLKGLTVEAWIKHEYGNCFIVKHTDEQGKNCYSLSWYEGKIRVELQSKEEPKTEELVVYTEDDFPDDHLWHHLAFSLGGYSSKDSSDGEVSIYIDGRLQRCVVNGRCSTILAAMQAKTIGLFKGFPTGFQGNLEIGSKEEGTDYYSIAICDIRLWKVARSPDQIQKYMTCRLSAQDAARELFVEYQHKAREAERDVLEDQPNDDVVNPPARAPEPNPDDSVLGYWKNLVGYWRLDDCSGEEAFNQKGKKHGVISNALRFPELKPEHKELVL
nr:LamG domain-containing protein [Leptolyngbyaceae cyanobacterium MO_188.B28]